MPEPWVTLRTAMRPGRNTAYDSSSLESDGPRLRPSAPMSRGLRHGAALGVAVIALAGFSACGGGGDKGAATTPTTTTPGTNNGSAAPAAQTTSKTTTSGGTYTGQDCVGALCP
jgi:hypothetical protein